MNEPLVTVGIPAYNHEEYIEEAIKSVIAQTYKNIELIIINDGSTDETSKIIAKLELECKNRFVNYVYIEQDNKGISYTLNKILNMARGEYFIITSSDDTQSENRVEEKLKFFLNNPEYDFCYAGYNDTRKDGTIFKTTATDENFELNIEEIFLRKREISYINYMAKTNSLIKIGGYIPGIKIEDWELALRVAKNNLKTFFLTTVTYNHRFHGNNTITKFEEMLEDRLKILDRYKEHPKYNEAVKFWKSFYNKYFFSKYFSYKLILNMYQEIVKYNNDSFNIVIYGNGSVGKMICSLIPNANYCFVDQLSEKSYCTFDKGETYSKDSLFKINFDYILISVFYLNDEIEEELITTYKIKPEKIIKF